MQEIYRFKDLTGDTITIDMLPMEQHGRDEVMFACGGRNSDGDYQTIAVLLPMDEVVKVINRLTIELDVIAHRSTPDPPQSTRKLD